MTPDHFKRLVATPGDTIALRPELASLPFWRDSKCNITMKHRDAKTFKEKCVQTAKTVAGRYIVFSTDSQFYRQTTHAIAGYDDKASALRLWALFGDTLTEATIVIDAERKISASTASYGEGFMEISVGSYSDKEMSDHTLVYKDGVLFMPRDVKTGPTPKAIKVESDGAANGQPIGSGTNQTSSAAGSSR